MAAGRAGETTVSVRGVAVGAPEAGAMMGMLSVMPVTIFMSPSGPKVAPERHVQKNTSKSGYPSF